MPFCPNCGKEVNEDAVFCSHCRTPLKEPEVTYRRPRRNWPLVQIVSVFFGGIIIITALGLLAGGTAVMWVQGEFSDAEGFLTSREVRLHTDSHALVLRNVDINMGVNVPAHFWAPRLSDFITVRLMGTSNDPSKETFIGIAMESDAWGYLGGVEHEEVSAFDWDYNPWRETQPQISYYPHGGSAPSGPPTLHSFWIAHATGPGTQTLMWEPEVGSFGVVVMNADGSAGIDTDMRFGAKVPILRTIGNGLMVGGIITLIIGGLIIYFGVFLQRTHTLGEKR